MPNCQAPAMPMPLEFARMSRRQIVRVALSTLLIGWSQTTAAWEFHNPPNPPPPVANTNPVIEEKDRMLSLAVLNMVFRDWQDGSPSSRGHNIGSILTDAEYNPVFYARNSVTTLNNGSQHGEVRTIQAFLECPTIGRSIPANYRIYTTLEPCAMCSGMMAMTQVSNVVFVQVDPEFGGALDALEAIWYPRRFKTYTPVGLPAKIALENGWENYKKQRPNESITAYLASAGAKQIYSSSYRSLVGLNIRYPENISLKFKILKFLNEVGPERYGKEMLRGCPVNPPTPKRPDERSVD